MNKRTVSDNYVDLLRYIIAVAMLSVSILCLLASKVNLLLALVSIGCIIEESIAILLVIMSEKSSVKKRRRLLTVMKMSVLMGIIVVAFYVTVVEQVGIEIKAAIIAGCFFATLFSMIREAVFNCEIGSPIPAIIYWGALLLILSLDVAMKLIFILSLEQADTTNIISPLAHDAIVIQGGGGILGNHHNFFEGQRYAVDLVCFDEDGKNITEGMHVVAPCDGEIVRVVSEKNGEPAGEHLSIKTKNGTYVMLAHLEKGSVILPIGALVRKGENIAKVGVTGNTTTPHVHVQVQSDADYHRASGKPFWFSDRWGKMKVPYTGMMVSGGNE